MGMTEYERAKRLIEARPELTHFTGPHPVSVVEAAERILGVSLPPTYRRFLGEFGALQFNGLEIFGAPRVKAESDLPPNSFDCTLRMRSEKAIHAQMIIVSDDGMGGHYCIEQVKGGDTERAIVLVEGGRYPDDCAVIRAASDFGSFLYQEVKSICQEKG